MGHQHQYDTRGRQSCSTQTGKVYTRASELMDRHAEKAHRGKESYGDGHGHKHTGNSGLAMFFPAACSFVLLMAAIAFDSWISQSWFQDWVRVIWYALAYAPVGLPVIRDAIAAMGNGKVFSEFFLISIAALGAFTIGRYPEGVVVLLFYSLGEVFQTLAISRAKGNIWAMLDQRPDEVTAVRDYRPVVIKTEQVGIGEVIMLHPGEKLGLDGELLSTTGCFNTAVLTGESKPHTKIRGDAVLAGMINLNNMVRIRVTAPYSSSKLSRILELIQNATAQKAPTELFIRGFTRIFTPIVVALAIAICLLPYFFVDDYKLEDWSYRALVFLVISCPCALVISIPLGYFEGIGTASRNGILFKGYDFLDRLAAIQHLVMDKTGVITKGVFRVQEVNFSAEFDEGKIMGLVNALGSHSAHPVALAIRQYVGQANPAVNLENVGEIAGHGLKATVDGKKLLVGNFRMMDRLDIPYGIDPSTIAHTAIAVAYDNRFVGYITVTDSIKEDAREAIDRLRGMDVRVTMLSGDKSTVVESVANELGIDDAFGDLLSGDKVNLVKEIKEQGENLAFMAGGANDTPAATLCDVGIAMGGLGNEGSIETADVVIQNDRPSGIPTAILIGRRTRRVVWQNIILAFAVKAVVLVLGAAGLATMWEAVFADVGVSLVAILNVARIQRMDFDVPL
ncbi:cadmium-translocating P-type ATPase [Parapedobacter sp. ISTM3]|uniref:heavy metal translocating P-type ATPase n=1 Tax=Parapedobacter sp. ISTM3 TaxID=2800130 RepID=UPI001905A5CE|nr:heavy metal translocating P-type ATPase [Parapedobacter sp. ISTM3]MBK1439878.1 cadmium-translocating P-type ATPase [Parapedobacter sp. ISTM3]